MSTLTVSSKGQIVLPAALRRRLAKRALGLTPLVELLLSSLMLARRSCFSR